jgi:hypothetical protein
MNASEIALHLSTLRVVLRCEGAPRAQRALESVWHLAASRSFAAPRRELHCTLRATEDGFQLQHPSGEFELCSEDELAPRAERLLYREFFAQQARDALCVLHAAGVVDGPHAIVFAGESGAGKSALARAAVDAGLGYFADEHVITDGRALWGLPRAIHLDHHQAGDPPLPWHAGADIDSYRSRGPQGRERYTPLVAIPARRVPQAAVPIEATVLVALRRGERDEVRGLSTAERLSTLGQSTLVASDALAALATLPAAFALTWRDPAAALAHLRQALARPPA